MRSLERGYIFYGNEQLVKIQLSEQQTGHPNESMSVILISAGFDFEDNLAGGGNVGCLIVVR